MSTASSHDGRPIWLPGSPALGLRTLNEGGWRDRTRLHLEPGSIRWRPGAGDDDPSLDSPPRVRESRGPDPVGGAWPPAPAPTGR